MKRIKCISALLTLMFLFSVGTVNAQSKSFGQTQIKKEAIRIAPKTADAPSSEAKTLQASPKRLMTNGKSVESTIENRKAATSRNAVNTSNSNVQPATTVIEGKQESPKKLSINGESVSGTISKKNATNVQSNNTTQTTSGQKAQVRTYKGKKYMVIDNSHLKKTGSVKTMKATPIPSDKN